MTDHPADPRPRVTTSNHSVAIAGTRCGSCGYCCLDDSVLCMACGSTLSPACFSPEGTIWAGTVQRIEVNGRIPPMILAYIDLDEGPRLLAHVTGKVTAPQVGARARLVGTTKEGDPLAEVIC